MRGKASAVRNIVLHHGITPACAGKRKKKSGKKDTSRDHPRVCGEKVKDAIAPTALAGSPPRVRGKDRKLLHNLFGQGITPACAGKRLERWALNGASWDHPRVCGEKGALQLLGKKVLGSPPRVRGKAVVWLLTTSKLRITPACAGKRSAHTPHPVLTRDHPRVCGEKRAGLAGERSGLGSPPRVRGKEFHRSLSSVRSGITPACAGKSPKGQNISCKSWDHPRVCGEKPVQVEALTPQQGSPPRVRGKASTITFEKGFQRITPACAGKSHVGGV